jgi:predicted transcriptional regulator
VYFRTLVLAPTHSALPKRALFSAKGALSAAEIAEHIRATGRDINNRTVSFSLHALKKRGLAKSADGKWTHGYKPLPSRSEAASKRWNSRACTNPIS